MTIFAILMQAPQPLIIAEIEKHFKNDHLKVSESSYLVSAQGTAADLSATLGVFDAAHPEATPSGNAIIMSMAGYWGRAPTTTWEWIRSKLEAPPRG